MRDTRNRRLQGPGSYNENRCEGPAIAYKVPMGLTFHGYLHPHILMAHTKRSIIAAFFLLVLGPRNACAQYFLGLGGGPYWIAAGKRYVSDMHAYDLGACLVVRTPEALGYAAHIGLQQRRFHTNGYSNVIKGADRYLDLDMRLNMLALGCSARFPLGPGRSVFYDVGPEFCIELSEEKNGLAYTRDYAVNDTITYDHATRTLFELRDIRLRTGFSGDVGLSERLLLNIGLHGSIGGGAWAPAGGFISVGVQFSCGLLFDFQHSRR